MKNINIKLTIAIIISLFVANELQAQQFKSAYFLDNVPANIRANPAIHPDYGYISIPMLGNLGINVQSNSLSLDKIMFPTSKGLVTFLDPSVDATSFLNSLADNNTMNLNLDIQILGLGFYALDGYWNIGVNLNSNTNMNIPKDFFSFAKTGLASTGETYNVSKLAMQTDNYIDVSLGYSRKINEKIVVGATLKFLIGGANANLEMTNLTVTSTQDKFSVTSQGQMSAYLKGISATETTDETGRYMDGFESEGFGVAGYGAAIDLGITYRPIPNLKVVGAVTDLGFISWDKNANVTGASNASFEYTGFRIPIADGDESIESQFDTIADDAAKLMRFSESESVANTRMITTSFNAGAEYSILSDKIGFGLLYSGQISPVSFENELTVSSNFRPTSWFSAALSYSFLHSSFDTFGMVLNFHPSWINFMIGTDYMVANVSPEFIPISQKAVNIYFGLSIPIGVKAYRAKQRRAENDNYNNKYRN